MRVQGSGLQFFPNKFVDSTLQAFAKIITINPTRTHPLDWKYVANTSTYCSNEIFSKITLLAFIVTDSVVQETSRISSGVFMVRYIAQDQWFKAVNSGKEYLMRKGDRVAIYPPALHKDPEIFEDPLVS